MKISVILGRGVEGVGLTKNVVEFQKLFPEVKIFATIDRLWPRMHSMPFEKSFFRGADWDTISKAAKKFPDLMTCEDVINQVNKSDMCIVYSVPSKGHPEECIDNFVKLLENITVRKSLIQVDHKGASIHRNGRLKDVCEAVDVLMCHSTENPFAQWVRKQNIKTPITSMGVGFNFNKDYWKPIEDQDTRYVRWVGRTAMWKGPDVMIDLHNDHFKHAGFITVLEGLEASIQYPLVLYKNPKERKDRREVINYFRPERDIDAAQWLDRKPKFGTENGTAGAYLYPGYVHSDMMDRMSKSCFGSDLMYFKENTYGNNIEYCHSDSFAAGVVPIFHKHFCDNVVHRTIGDPISQCKNSGTLAIDFSNAAEVTETMKVLANDNGMRDDWRNQMFEFWKDHCDSKVIYNDIIDKTLKYNEVEQHGLEAFF